MGIASAFIFLHFSIIYICCSMETSLFDFLETCMRHKNEMVIYEAANALTRLPNVTSKDLGPAISVLQLFCSSPKPSQRFAAVRTLSKVCFYSLPITLHFRYPLIIQRPLPRAIWIWNS